MPSPLYSNYLEFAPTFRWGGREWGVNDAEAFRKKMGKRYAAWARNHPSAARVFSPVEQQIYSAYQPQLNALEREREERRAYYDRLMKNLGGFTSAVGGMLAPIPGAVRGVYDQGANTMTAAGTGYGNQMNAEMGNLAGEANAYLSEIDSPAQLAGGDAGSVLAGIAGWLPSEMMKETGDAWGTRAEHFPTEAALQANLMMKDLLRRAAEEDKGFSGQVTDILSGLPGSRIELEQQMAAQQSALDEDQRKADLAERKFALDRLKAERDWWLRKQYGYLAQKKYVLAEEAGRRADEANTRLKNASAGLDYWGNPKPGYRVNPKTGLVEKIPTPKKPKAPKVPDWGKIQRDIDKDTVTLLADSKGMDYKTAFKLLWSRYEGMVKNKGRLRKLLKRVLAAHGIKPRIGPPAPGRTDPGPFTPPSGSEDSDKPEGW